MLKLSSICGLLTGVLFLSACGTSHNEGYTLSDPAPAQNSQIVGGESAQKSTVGAQSVFMLRGKGKNANGDKINSTCTAALIAPHVALTAAHCILGYSNLTARYGLQPLDPNSPSEAIPAEAILVHDHYSKTASISNDLALFRVSSPPKGMTPLTLPWRSAALAQMMTITPLLPFEALGYGDATSNEVNQTGNLMFGILRYTDQKITAYAEAKDAFLVSQSNGHGICEGDSGSPAIVQTSKTENTLVGIASQTIRNPKNPQADPCEFLGLYTNVSYYQEWIDDFLSEYPETR